MELDLGETTDFRSEVNENEKSEPESKFMLEDEDDTSIPKWPVYNSPLTQFDQIKSELT